MKKVTRSSIMAMVRKSDSKLNVQDEAFTVACILLSSLLLGTDMKKIAEFMEYNYLPLKKYEKRLKRSGIWKNGKVYSGWFKKKSGGIAFWCDALVVIGMLKRAPVKKVK